MEIKFTKPYMTGKELKYISDVIQNGLTMSGDGVYTRQVQELMEKRYGVKKVFLTTSGTSALEMAVRLLNLERGDEIIAPSFTFSSTINAILMSFGVRAVFAEINPKTFNIEPDDIEKKITSKTKAIMLVHYAGVACDMDRIMAIAKKHNLKVIEDAAQAIEAKYNGKFLGTIGDFGCLSFHDTKNITCGEGGALFINRNDENVLNQAEIIREKGTNRSQFIRGLIDKYTWVDIGSSYLPSDLLAAFLYGQMEQVEKITKLRLKVYQRYFKAINVLDKNLFSLPEIPRFATHNAHIFYVIMNTIGDRNFVLDYLRSKGIKASFHYIPLHSSPQGEKMGYTASDLPITEEYGGRLLRLPIYSGMKVHETDYVIENFKSALSELSKRRPTTVSVGISALNEEKSIVFTVKSLLNQNYDNFTLENVVVVSDGSKDRTVEKLKAINDTRIKIIDHSNRQGKSVRLNEMFETINSDILVLTDADIKPKDKNSVINLIKPFLDDPKLMFVAGKIEPFKPNGFFEKILYTGTQLWDQTRFDALGKGKESGVYFSGGAFRAMKRSFYKEIIFPSVKSEDAFPYLFALSKNYKFQFVNEAVVYYKLPSNFKDFKSQMKRYLQSANEESLIFNEEFVSKSYTITNSDKVVALTKQFIKNPIYVTLYVSILMVPKIQSIFENVSVTGIWEEVKSSKI